MKSPFIFISLLVFCTVIHGQNTEAVENAFAKGDASELSSQLAAEVEFCIGDDVEFYSKKEASQALNHWIKQHAPTAIEGKIVGGSSVKYYNGELTTEKGRYRIMIYYIESKSAYKIDEIRIVKK